MEDCHRIVELCVLTVVFMNFTAMTFGKIPDSLKNINLLLTVK